MGILSPGWDACLPAIFAGWYGVSLLVLGAAAVLLWAALTRGRP